MNHNEMEILKAEISGDPLARGYSGMSDLEVADDLNTVYRTITMEYVSGSDIFNATDDIEYGALTDAQKAAWDRLCGIESIDTTSGIAKSREVELFGPGTNTRSNLQALKIIDVSRAAELLLPIVREGNVQEARL